MGNVESTENGGASLAGLEALIVDPSTILGESQQDIAMRNQLPAQSDSPLTLSVNPDGAGSHEESQLREAEPEILQMLNPLALFPSTFIDGDEEPLPRAQPLAHFVETYGYINFLLMIININIKTN